MRVFVAGASGAIGRRLVPQLVAAGHEVTGTTRSEESAERIRAAGAEAVVCDVFDRRGGRRGGRGGAARGGRQPADQPARALRPAQDRLRADQPGPRSRAARNLIAAARAAGARRLRHPEHRLRLRARGRLGEGRGGADLQRRARAASQSGVEAALDREREALEARRHGGARPALRAVLRARHLLRPRRLASAEAGRARAASRSSARATASSPSSTSTTPPRRRSPRVERGAAGHLQRRRRRPGADARVAAGLRARRSARSRRVRVPRLAGPAGRRPRHRRDGDRSCAAPRTRRRSASWAGSRAHPSWRQGFREALG